MSEDQLAELASHLQSPQLQEYIAWLEQNAHTSSDIETFFAQREAAWNLAIERLAVTDTSYTSIVLALQQRLELFETALHDATGLNGVDTEMEWQHVSELLKQQVPELLHGWFVKTEVLQRLLEQNPPNHIVEYLGYANLKDCLANENMFEIYSALRFAESGEWMDMFLSSYNTLTAEDFEERDVQLLRLDPAKWWNLAKPFAAKKKHHFSHLKEAGVIFTYPAPTEDATPQPLHVLLAMAFHYTYEVRYYSDFFSYHIHSPQSTEVAIGEVFINTLRGDVDVPPYASGQLPIIQQYHLKHSDAPAMAYAPHVMPEAMHWQSALRELVNLVGADNPQFDFINDCYTVAREIDGKLLTLHLADVMLSFQNGLANNMLTYHYKEDLWNALVGISVSPATLRLATIEGLANKVVHLPGVLAQQYRSISP